MLHLKVHIREFATANVDSCHYFDVIFITVIAIMISAIYIMLITKITFILIIIIITCILND